MQNVHYLTIDENAAGQRIDNFLITYLKAPRALIYRIIRKGEVRANKKRVDPTYRLQLQDEIRIPPVHLEAKAAPPALSKDKTKLLQQAILFENDLFLVLNKPSGIPVHGGSGIALGLIEMLRMVRPDLKFLELAHRLDRETSGCLLIAKKMSILRELHALLRERQVKKIYHALVVGAWPKNLNKIETPIDDKPSLTTFQILQKKEDTTLIAAHPLTGRNHQIRIHTASVGHPIVGDDKYGHFAKNRECAKKYGFKRLCLHAAKVSFVLPSTGEAFSFSAENEAF